MDSPVASEEKGELDKTTMIMIKAFAIDIDGCLNKNGMQHETETIGKIRKLKESQAVWDIILVTGRDWNYTLEYCKKLGCRYPAVCENGGILLYPNAQKIEMTIDVGKNRASRLHRLNEVLEDNLKKLYPGYVREPGKSTMVSLNPPKRIPIGEFFDFIRSLILENFSEFHATRSSTAVDISFKEVDKATGVKSILKNLKIDPAETCGIGDSLNDVCFLKIVGIAACPANAEREVKKECDYVSSEKYEKGALDIISKFGCTNGR